MTQKHNNYFECNRLQQPFRYHSGGTILPWAGQHIKKEATPGRGAAPSFILIAERDHFTTLAVLVVPSV